MRYLVLLVAMLAFGACSVEAAKTPQRVAQDMVNKITYVRDHNTGMCFAIVSTRKTGTVNTSGVGLTDVPCDKLGK